MQESAATVRVLTKGASGAQLPKTISSVAEKIMITFSPRGQLAGGPGGDWQEAQA